MNLFEKILGGGIRNFFAKRGRGADAKSFISPSLLELGADSSRLPDPSARNYYPYSRSYADKPWVYACVSVITDAISDLNIALKNERGEVIKDHALLKLFYKPNSFMSGKNLMRWIAGSLELTGNAYLLKDARRSGAPSELFPLVSHFVEVMPGKSAQKPVEGYKYRAGGKTAIYQAQDVVHIKYFNPFDFYYGLSPLSAARYAADTLSAAETYNRAFFDNSAMISGVLSTDQRLDASSRSRIMSAWQDRHRGEAKAHKVALLEGGLKWQAIGMSQKDMDFVAGMKLNRETVLAVFHVPPALVGVYDHAPQFNTKEQQRIFYSTCVLPKTSLILDAFNEFLAGEFDPSGKIYFEADISAISALREDETS
ncbi:MAG: phage portal protein, partial [Elusimicrobia bacterium]|nr:phage portal protein [Elusimicrobiota bacterium]